MKVRRERRGERKSTTLKRHVEMHRVNEPLNPPLKPTPHAVAPKSLILKRRKWGTMLAEDLSITGLKWAAAWQRWSVPSIMWRSGAGLGKGLGSGSSNPEGFNCSACGRVYKLKSSLRNHQKWECGKEPQFQCPHCVYRAKQKMHIARHMERMHKEKIYKQELV
ncbi:hypothetical protein DMN91_012938 [Ooceraea biroi]|uniref:C2H2-type domain-containing protein n=1 Tax=Ooceraea biroi TaxID=2015173 RepID=A0A3L8D4I7_OOCBI|nr:hypothetical protein DMN91_012938 [Ooceraea biroi]